MMNLNPNDWRNRRNFLNNMSGNLNPMHYSISSYCTDQKSDMKAAFGDDLFLNNLHLLPNLDRNLGDTVITEGNAKRTKMATKTKAEEADKQKRDTSNRVGSDFSSLSSGIGGFISGVFNAITGVVFQRRSPSPTLQYHDCFDQEFREGHDNVFDWHSAKINDQNKTVRAREHYTYSDGYNVKGSPEMNTDVTVVSQCEDKLKKVQLLLTNKSVAPPKFRRKPRKIFVEPNSVEENFEDAFCPEDFVQLSNKEYVSHVSAIQNQNPELLSVEAPKTKTEIGVVEESTEIVKTLPNKDTKTETIAESAVENSSVVKDTLSDTKMVADTKIIEDTKVVEDTKLVADTNLGLKEQLISTCEDKLTQLKALLQDRKKVCLKMNHSEFEKPPEQEASGEKTTAKAIVATSKVHDKHFKNPNRTVNKRRKCNIRRNIEEDMKFANEIDREELSSNENSPKISEIDLSTQLHCRTFNEPEEKESFDEVAGRFRTASTTSEDSFQIVFADTPTTTRARMHSDCESEDSFIVFEESPDSCYISQDVFGDEDFTDSESEHESDDGLSTCKLSHDLSRTIGDLTDDSLYDDSKCADVVDCAFNSVCEEIPSNNIHSDSVVEAKSSGLLLDAAGKLLKKEQPKKKVTFSAEPPRVLVMRVWSFAARQARRGRWERDALDRERFKRRIADVDVAISWVLKPQHRKRVMFQRFMPWWHAQRRKEVAERKQREEEEKKRLEEEAEKKRLEEEQRRLEEERLRAKLEKGIKHLSFLKKRGKRTMKNKTNSRVVPKVIVQQPVNQIIQNIVQDNENEVKTNVLMNFESFDNQCNDKSKEEHQDDLKETQDNLQKLQIEDEKGKNYVQEQVNGLEESKANMKPEDVQQPQASFQGTQANQNENQEIVIEMNNLQNDIVQGNSSSVQVKPSDIQEMSTNSQVTESKLQEIPSNLQEKFNIEVNTSNLEEKPINSQHNRLDLQEIQVLEHTTDASQQHTIVNPSEKVDNLQENFSISQNKRLTDDPTLSVHNIQESNTINQDKEESLQSRFIQKGKTLNQVVNSNKTDKSNVNNNVELNSVNKLAVDKHTYVNLNGLASNQINNVNDAKKPRGYFKKFAPKQSEVNLKIEKMNKMLQSPGSVDKNKLNGHALLNRSEIDTVISKFGNIKVNDSETKKITPNGYVNVEVHKQ